MPGDTAKIVANCGTDDSDGEVQSVELRGSRVRVAGLNSTYEHAETGEEMVGVTMENGALAAVPSRCMRHENTTARTGYSRRFANAWRAIFGKDE